MPLFGPVYPFVLVITFSLGAIVHIIFALAIKQDGEILRSRNYNTFLVSPTIWALATLVGGVFVAVAYWIVHYSALCQETPLFEKTDASAKQDENSA